MALYGPNAGVVPFTGYSPTLGIADAITPATSGQVAFDGMTQDDGKIAALFREVPNRVARKLLLTLLGVVSGSTATETRSRVTAQQGITDFLVLGGIVPIEAQSLVNRATTAADITNLTAMLSRTTFPASYVADASGNGGGGRSGF